MEAFLIFNVYHKEVSLLSEGKSNTVGCDIKRVGQEEERCENKKVFSDTSNELCV